MRLGFDIDGVLANFVPSYQQLTITHAGGVNLFHPDDINNPPCWNWPEYRGYAPETMQAVWGTISRSHSFWYGLEPHIENVQALGMCIEDLEHTHDVYFVTSRPGQTAKRQTEAWLTRWLPYPSHDVRPTVLLASSKGAAAKALKLDVYLDDNLDNIKDVLTESPKTRAYLLDRSYNQGDVAVTLGGECCTDSPVTRTGIRVTTLAALLDRELLNL